MYAASHFRVDEREALLETARVIGFAAWVVASPDGLSSSHLPVVVRELEEGVVLEAHVARPNPLWRLSGPAMAIFQGPNAYISPAWYATKAEHGRVVPTWNYVAVHFHGEFEAIDDQAWLMGHLERLTHEHEALRPEPWTPGEAPAGFIEGLTKAIVGLRMRVDRMEGICKMSQNQPEANRRGVIAGLVANEPELAALVKAELLR